MSFSGGHNVTHSTVKILPLLDEGSQGNKLSTASGHGPKELTRALSGKVSKQDHVWVLENCTDDHSGDNWQQGTGGRDADTGHPSEIWLGSGLTVFSVSKFTRVLGVGQRKHFCLSSQQDKELHQHMSKTAKYREESWPGSPGSHSSG